LGLFLDFSTFSSLSLLSQGGAERKEGRMADDEGWPDAWRGPIEMTDADREAIRRFAGVRRSPPWESADTTGDAPVKPGASIHDLLPTRRTTGVRRKEDGRHVGKGAARDFLMPFGKYQNLTLAQVAREPGGRDYLWRLASSTNGQFHQNLEAFLRGKRRV
jgi:hypothetical protein